MKLLVVTVNFRTPEITARSMEATMADLDGLSAGVVVVENGSGDDSLARLRTTVRAHGWQDRVEIVDAGRNGGFGAGNNVALRRALEREPRPQYVYLLNPDAFVRPGTLRAIVDFMDAHPQVGIAGTRIVDEEGHPQVSAFRFPSALSELERGLRLGVASRLLRRWSVWADPPRVSGPVDWVSGASCVIRTDVLERIGLFDEGFFLYFEETDLCRRAAAAGISTWYLDDAEVMHLEGVATGIKDKQRRIPGFWLDSRRRYFLKAGGPLRLLLADAAWATAFASWRVRRRFQGKPDDDPPQALQDFLAHRRGRTNA